MENFGLGIVLSLTDNVSGAMNSIMGNLDKLQDEFTKTGGTLGDLEGKLSKLPSLLIGIGGATTALGASLSAPFVGMAKASVQAGATLENQMNMLSTLYGSAEKGKEAYLWAQKFAAESPMALSDVIGMMQTLKPIGADVQKMYATTSGQMQGLLKFITDFSASRPDVPVFRIQGALRNLAGGNYKSIQQIFDLPNDVIERMKKGKDIGEKIAIAVNGLGVSGFTEKMNGSWTQMMSNLDDSWEAFKTNIANSGVFDTAKAYLKDFFDVVNNLTNEDFKTMATPIAEGISIVLAPAGALVKVLKWLIETYRDMSKEYPQLVGGIMEFVSAFGTMLTVVGGGIVLYGLFLKLSSAYSAFMMSAVGTTKLLSAMRIGFMAVARSAMATMFSMLPLLVVMGALYLAWRTNFLGIRDLINSGLTRLVDIIGILVDFIDGKLSKKNFNLAKQYGMLEFLATWAEASRVAQSFVTGIKNGIFETIKWFDELNTKYVNFKKFLGIKDADHNDKNMSSPTDNGEGAKVNAGFVSITNEQAEAWGNIASIVLMASVGLKILASVLKPVVTILKVLGQVLRFIAPAFRVIMSAGMMLARVLLIAIGAIATVLSVPVWVVGVVVALIVGLVALIITYWDELCAFFDEVWQAILEGFDNFCTMVNEGFNAIREFCQNVWNSIVDTINGAIDTAISTIDNLYSSVLNTFTNIYNYVTEVWGNIKEMLSHPIDAVINFMSSGSPMATSGFAMLANGGVITKPTPAIIGEAGYDEVVVPIDYSQNAISLWKTAGQMLGLIGEDSDTQSTIDYNRTTNTLNNGFSNVAKSISRQQNSGESSQTITNSDNRVIFGEGSIVIYATPNQDPYAVAREVMAQAERKAEIREMMMR